VWQPDVFCDAAGFWSIVAAVCRFTFYHLRPLFVMMQCVQRSVLLPCSFVVSRAFCAESFASLSSLVGVYVDL